MSQEFCFIYQTPCTEKVDLCGSGKRDVTCPRCVDFITKAREVLDGDVDKLIEACQKKFAKEIKENLKFKHLAVCNEVPFLFGSCEDTFCGKKLRKLVNEGHIEDAKAYVSTYFLKMMTDKEIAMWTPNKKEGRITVKPWTAIKGNVLKALKYYKLSKGEMKKEFDLHEWFFLEDDDHYDRIMKVNEPIIYHSKGGQYLNLFPGFMHKEKEYNTFSEDIRNGVDVIWEHIRIVWCSDQEETFKYVKNWLISLICGKKMDSTLLLISEEGTGKSLITDFICYFVLGELLGHIIPDHHIVEEGGFNHQLVGKILLVLEEPKADKKTEWLGFENKMKHFTTGKPIQINTKNIAQYTIDNVISTIIRTNNNLVMKGRRTAVLPVSNEKIGNRKYFKSILKHTNNKEVGHAFYSYCRQEFANIQDFDYQKQEKNKKWSSNLSIQFISSSKQNTYLKRKE